jgi:hypothetical protein
MIFKQNDEMGLAAEEAANFSFLLENVLFHSVENLQGKKSMVKYHVKGRRIQ